MAWDRVIPAMEQQAARTPAAIAVRQGDRFIDYATLHARSNRLARGLQARGIARGDRVAIMLPRTIDAIVGIVAVLKAGAAYVPVDPTYPAARIKFILDDAGVGLTLTSSRLEAHCPPGGNRLLLDLEADALADMAPDPMAPQAAADDAIYVIYTSGSTGQPKGAAVSHRSFSNLLQWYVATLGLGADDATLLVSALGFDLTQKNIYAPLLVGGTLHLPDGDAFDPEAIVSEIENSRITVLNCTPSTFMPLVEGPAAQRPGRLASLRWVVLGGEPIPVTRLLPWLTDGSCRARVLNSYGPTECTDICAAWAIDGQAWQDPVPLGRPIDNVFLAVLDASGAPVEAGAEGELWIGGAGVGLGYLGRPDLNADRFQTLSLPEFSGLMYRTGDRVRWREDSCLDFFGRIDHQVKIRGHRVELGEIEAVLASRGDVRESVVVVRQDDAPEPRVVAYVVPKAGAVLPPYDILRAFLLAALPEHMVPALVVPMDALPLSPNGKIDRHALPAPVRPKPAGRMAPAGRTDMEALVSGIWQEALGREPDATDQNFFDLGGTSIGMAEVQAGLRRKLGRDVPIVALFANPTIASLARHLLAGPEATAATSATDRAARQSDALRRMAMARGTRR